MSNESPNRTAIVMTIAIVAVIGVLVAIFIAGNNSPSSTTQVIDAQAVTSMLQGIPQSGMTLGSEKAPLQLYAYEDLKCPICQQFNLNVFPTLITDYVKNGKMNVTYIPQTFVGQQAAPGDTTRAAEFGLATAQQNKFWNYAELFYHNQQDENSTYVTNAFLTSLAAKVPGLDGSKALSEMSASSIAQQISAASQEFQSAGFNGTPSFQISKNNGARSTLAWHSLTVSDFTTPINQALASQ